MKRKLKVLVGCEFSGVVRDAFLAQGHDAISCDLLPTESPGPHYQGDIMDLINDPFDLAVFHPTCTFLTCAAEWAYGPGPYHQKVKPGTLVGEERKEAREEAIEFALRLWNAPNIPLIALENPVGVLSRYLPKPQIIQPYNFGHDASKATCLFLKGLPPLCPTSYHPPRVVGGKYRWDNQTDGGQNKLSPSADRGKLRSVTYKGIAEAMAAQWPYYTGNQTTNK